MADQQVITLPIIISPFTSLEQYLTVGPICKEVQTSPKADNQEKEDKEFLAHNEK